MPLSRWHKATFFGILALVTSLGGLVWWNLREEKSRLQELERDTHVVAHQLANQMQQALQQHLISLQSIANFWENSEEVTEGAFYNFAATTHKLTPLCARIVVVDPSFHVRWVYPPDSNRDLVGFDVKGHREGYETQLRAMSEKRAVLSPPLRLVGGAEGFVLIAPMFRKGKYLGSVVCSFRNTDFFGSLQVREIFVRYEGMVFDEGTPLFASNSKLGSRPDFPFVSESFGTGGRTWEIQLRPSQGTVQGRLQSGEKTYWALGLFFVLVVGGMAWVGTYYATGASIRLRSHEEALQQTRSRLDNAMGQLLQAEKMTALGELVAGVAHELNNPLASIMGYSQLALTHEPTPEIRRYLETVCSETQRAGKIVRNLLAFARKQPPEKKYLGLNGILEKTLELKAYHFRSNQIEVEKILDPRLPMTMLDFHQMQQVLLNLLNNAEQAMQEAGRGGSIRVSTRHAGDRIEAKITDSGPGVPREIQDRIFEPFFTTKQEGKGTGLGLSLCYGILQEHGGSLRVESQPGQGATFIIDLPIVQECGVEANGTSIIPSAGPSSGLRVLVIDDEPNVQSILVEVLSSMGHRSDTASDVPEALRKIEANGHNLIITDMKMPRGTGVDIYRAVVRRSPSLARRVIFTTGDGASAETQRFIKETGNEILLKPWSLEDLEKAIASAINK